MRFLKIKDLRFLEINIQGWNKGFWVFKVSRFREKKALRFLGIKVSGL
jgi:hypothetical protein